MPNAIESIHHEHARLAEALAAANEAMRIVRDDGVLDPTRWREVRRFIHEIALPHLRHEENDLFPRARAMGLTDEMLEFLRRDHEGLRFLARRAEASGLTENTQVLDLETAEVIDRFVRAFDEHARREEAMFLDLESKH
jgi:hemerythrin-like domain-containing protein